MCKLYIRWQNIEIIIYKKMTTDYILIAAVSPDPEDLSLFFKSLFIIFFLLIIFLSKDDSKKEMERE